MYVITVTIGRNVGETPMSDASWAEYRSDVAALLDDLATFVVNPTFEFHNGYGEWHGVAEDSHKATLMSTHEFDQSDISWLRRSLSHLCRKYEQDAIALTVGTSVLCM